MTSHRRQLSLLLIWCFMGALWATGLSPAYGQANEVTLTFKGKVTRAPAFVTASAKLTAAAPSPVDHWEWVLRNTTTNELLTVSEQTNRALIKMPTPGTYTVLAKAVLSDHTIKQGQQSVVVTGPAYPFSLSLRMTPPRFNRAPASYLFWITNSYVGLTNDGINNKSWQLTITNSDTGEIVKQGAASSLRYIFTTPGSYIITAYAKTNIFGFEDTESTVITVPPNISPTVDAIKVGWVGRQNGDGQYEVRVFSHDDDGRVVKTGLTIDGIAYTRSQLRTKLKTNGQATITATVTDDSGATGTFTEVFSVGQAEATPLDAVPGAVPQFAVTPDPAHHAIVIWAATPPKGISYDLEHADGDTLTNGTLITGITKPAPLPLGNNAIQKTVRMRFTNSAGAGPWSPPVVATVLSPPVVEATPISYGATVTWGSLPPATHAIVRAQVKSTNTIQEVELDEGVNTYTFLGLTAGQVYRITAVATSLGHRSESSSGIEVTPSASIPDPPQTPGFTEDVLNQRIQMAVPSLVHGFSYNLRLVPGTTIDGTAPVTSNLFSSPLLAPIPMGTAYLTGQLQLVNPAGPSNWSTPFTVPVMAIPMSPQITVTGPHTADVQLPPIDPAFNYKIKVWPKNDPTQASTIFAGSSGVTTLTTLRASTDYAAALAVSNTEQDTAWGGATNLRTQQETLTLAAPDTVTVTPGDQQLQLTWPAVPDATGYLVWVQPGPTVDPTTGTKHVVTGNTLTLPGLNNFQPYSVLVQATAWDVVSPSSVLQTATPVPPIILSIPTNPVATGSDSTLTVTWDPVAQATGYDIDWVVGTQMDHSVAHRLSTTTAPLTLPGLSNGGVYSLSIRATAGSITSDWSPALTASPVPGPIAAPTQPTVVDQLFTADISWPLLPDATGYEIGITTGSGWDPSLATVKPVGNGLYQAPDLILGTTYTVSVRATKGTVTSAWSPATTFTRQPLAPIQLQATGINNGIHLTWTPQTQTGQYEVGVSPTATWDPTAAVITSSSNPFVDLTTLTPGQSYAMAVRAVGPSPIQSPWSTPLQVTIGLPVPTGVALVTTETTLTVNWGLNAAIPTYEVARVMAPSFSETGATIQSVSAGPVVWTDVATGDTWSVAVRSVSGTIKSPWVSVSATIPPPTPAQLTAIAGSQAMTVNWQPVLNATSYDIRYVAGTTFNGTVSSILSVPGTSTQVTGLTANQDYAVEVRALVAGVPSSWSPAVFVMPFMGVPLPTNVTATATPTSVTVGWVTPPGVSGTEIGYLLGSSFVETTATVQAAPSSPFVITGVIPGQTWSLGVRSTLGGTPSTWVTASVTIPPAIPAGVTATGIPSGLTVNWTAVSNATSYDVQSVAGTTLTAGIPTVVSTTTPSLTLSSLSGGQPYTIAVRAVAGSGVSAWSDPVTGTPVATIAAPTGLTVTPGDGQLVVNWTPVAGATGYAIGYQTGTVFDPNTATLQTVLNGTTTTAILTGLTPGTTYVVAIEAQAPSAIASWSSSVTASPTMGTPTGFTVTPPNSWVLAASWNPSAIATGYDVGYHLGTSFDPTQAILLSPASGTTLSITNIQPGLAYVIAVRARSSTTTSPWSSGTAVVVPATGLAGSAFDGSVNLSWAQAGVPLDGYDLGYSAGPIFDPNAAGILHVSGILTTASSLSGLTNGTTYAISIRGTLNGVGYNWAPAIQATPFGPVPGGLTVTPGNSQVTASWTPAPGATGYVLAYNQGNTFNGGTATSITIPSGTTGSQTITGLTNGTAYTFQIMSQQGTRVSAWSSPVTTIPLATTTGLTLTQTGDGQITASWASTAGATGYVLGYQAGTTFDGTTATTQTIAGGTVVTAVINGLTTGTSYVFAVRAQNGTTLAPWSITAQLTPQVYVTRFYRDARDMSGPGPFPSICKNAWWYEIDNSQPQCFNEGATYSTATMIRFNGEISSGPVFVSTPVSLLTPTTPSTYTLWLYLDTKVWNAALSVKVNNTLVQQQDVLFTNGFRWVSMGPITLSNTDTLQVAGFHTVSGGVNDGKIIALRGIYVTSGSETPSATPSGQGGDSTGVQVSAPTGLAATPGDSQVTMAWTTVPGATGYVLSYNSGSSYSSGGATNILIPNGTTTSQVITGLTNGTPYTVQIQSYQGPNGTYPSPWSASVTSIPFGTVTGLTLNPVDSQITATWAPVSGATGYLLAYSAGTTFNAGTATTLTIAGGMTSSQVITGLTNGTAYTFKIQSQEGTALSAWSSPMTATPAQPISRLYRDGRDLLATALGQCTKAADFASWIYSDDGTGSNCAGALSYAAANSMWGYAGMTAPVTITTLSSLPSTATLYKVWFYAAYGTQSRGGTVSIKNPAGEIVTPSIPTVNQGAFTWLYGGTLHYTAGDALTLSTTAGTADAYIQLRGVYFTTGNETPVSAPSGQGGDSQTQQ